MTDKNTIQLVEPQVLKLERRSKTITKIALKMSKIMEDIGYVQKKGKNKNIGYSFVASEDLVPVCTEALIKNKVIMLTDTEEYYREPLGAKGTITTIKIRVTFIDVESEEFLTSSFIGEGSDFSGDKGAAKAHTNANKYALLKTFGVASGDDPEYERARETAINRMSKDELKANIEEAAKQGGAALMAKYDELGKARLKSIFNQEDFLRFKDIKDKADQASKKLDEDIPM
jgi:hypothetical protein